MDEMQIPGSSTDRLVVTYAYLACSGAPASGLRTGRGSQLIVRDLAHKSLASLRPVYGPDEDRNLRACTFWAAIAASCVRSTDRTRIATPVAPPHRPRPGHPASGLRTGRGSQQ